MLFKLHFSNMKFIFLCISVICTYFASTQAASWNQASFPHPFDRNGKYMKAKLEPWMNYTQTTYWFTEQRLNHFDMTDRTTWSQRYFVIDDFWKPPYGPVILHVCGEYTCPGIMPSRLFPVQMAYETNALIVSVEHRFFGKSQPFANLSTEFLIYHNSRQALNDLAYFSQWFQQTYINKAYKLNVDNFNRWAVVGGSYPGALSAWYRLKYPHLVQGSHSSSGVVDAILDFTKFDQQVAISAGDACAAALRDVTKRVEAQMPGIKTKFLAQNLNDGDFYYLVADSAAEAMQYGHHQIPCDAITPVFNSGGDPLPAYLNYTLSFFYNTMGNSPSDYDTRVTANPVKGGNGRSWWWLKCTELAYWQVAPAQNSIRSQYVNNAYFQSVCQQSFGISNLPDVNATNNYYGGNHPVGSEVFFVNGVEDPWQWAGVRKPRNNLLAEVVDCDDCAHCVDLYTPTPNDPIALKNERKFVQSLYRKWLVE